jgi:hypothetical protein
MDWDLAAKEDDCNALVDSIVDVASRFVASCGFTIELPADQDASSNNSGGDCWGRGPKPPQDFLSEASP